MELTRKAYAKVNWNLQVLGAFPPDHPDADYTDIESTLILLDLYDEVTVRVLSSRNRGLTIECHDPRVPQTQNENASENVCAKAVRALFETIPSLPENDLHIRLQKNIPLAGGLGGSSTDGAAVLEALDTLWSLSLSRKEKMEIASSFGSDTAFFASGYCVAQVVGRGIHVREVSPFLKQASLVCVYPQRELFVGDVYQSLRESEFPGCGMRRGIDEFANDLEYAPYVQEVFPEREEICRVLCESGCSQAQMSGSGPTCYGVVSEEETSAEIVAHVQERFPKYDVFTANPL